MTIVEAVQYLKDHPRSVVRPDHWGKCGNAVQLGPGGWLSVIDAQAPTRSSTFSPNAKAVLCTSWVIVDREAVLKENVYDPDLVVRVNREAGRG